MIPTFKLNNNVEVPAISFGTYKIKEDDEAIRCIRDAVSVGYRSFDTAMFYKNEGGIGQGIKDCGVPRSELHITTKLWNDSHGYDEALRAFDASLKRLGLDYIDEYLIHWPGLDEQFIPTWKAFEKLYKEGLIRVIGVCNFTKPILKQLLDNCEIVPMIDQLEIHPFFAPNDIIKFCQNNEIQVEAWRPIARGKLDKEPIVAAANKYGKTPAQITLRWHYQRGIRALPKTTHKDRMVSNIDIFDFQLEDSEMAAINALNTFIRTAQTPDEFFIMG